MDWIRESVTYQSILAEGREEGREQGLRIGVSVGLSEGRVHGARSILLRIGTRKLGAPPAAILARLNAMTDIDAIEALAEQVLTAETWDALFPPRTAP